VKTHSSSLEADEAEKVRARFAQDAKPSAHTGGASSRHGAQAIVPKIDLSHISKPGDVLKAVLAKKHEEAHEPRRPQTPAQPAAAAAAKPAEPAARAATAAPAIPAKPIAPAAARPEPRKIVPQPRSAPPIISPPP